MDEPADTRAPPAGDSVPGYNGAPSLSASLAGGVFDHLIRSDESYDQKWDYIRSNSVRAGLASTADDWPFAGELTIFRR